jgi:GDP-L-fucose synthase
MSSAPELPFDLDAQVLVTGAGGMIGSALARRLRALGCRHVLAPVRPELDLRDAAAVSRYFLEHRPEFVFMIAARVGGIAANVADPVGFLTDNAQIAINTFDACRRSGVAKALYLGSSCVYPRLAPQPMREEYLMTGPLEPTNEGYALAKILGLRLADAYHRQYGLKTVCLIPCNMYGTGDHFDFERAHVLSALVRRFVDAVEGASPAVTVWGTGVARREFIHVDDVVDAVLFMFGRLDEPPPCNIGSGVDVSIRELADLIAQETGFAGDVRWDASKPDGMPRKCLDITRQTALGFVPRVSLVDGIRRTIAEYRMQRVVPQPS